MNNRIKWVLILMGLCVAGIGSLQLYWNYQNYQRTVTSFTNETNAALVSAVDREIALRHDKIAKRFKSWLLDSSFVTITCNNDNRHKSTVFHMIDTHPLNPKEKGVYLGISGFKISLSHITNEAKLILVNHFINYILKEDLKKGIVYNYTQRLGDSLLNFYSQCKLDTNNLNKLYKQELVSRNIRTAFVIYQGNAPKNGSLYITRPVNTALNRPYEKEMVTAQLQRPDSWYLSEMKWLIITSVLLIGITLYCFAYTARTLLSQHRLNVLKDDFINNMTHELNTPIASIQITTDALQAFHYNREKQLEYLQMISYQTKKLTDLTVQVLRSSQPIKELINHRIGLNVVIKKAIEDLNTQAKFYNAIIDFEACFPDIYINGYEIGLVSAITNVIENALKYNSDQPMVLITLTKNKNIATIKIADNGPGIPSEYKLQIFERFFRIPQGNVHDIKGYGLGLSYVRKIIMEHQGTISIADNLPKGSVFIIDLPLQ